MAVIILICIAGLSISGVTYASISGRLSGVYKAEPELVAQLDHPNPIQEAVDTIPIIPPKDPNRFDGSEIISASSFENDQFFNSATDIELDNLGEGVYATDDFIYDQKDIAVFTRENGDSWYLNAGESLQITIAIDTSFAASEARGEQMTLAYIKDGMFFELSLERIVDTPNTYTFVAPEDGDYYLAIINESFSYLKVTTLEIRQ